MNRETTCLLCGETSRDVKPLVVCWREATGSEYQVIPRCANTNECYERVLRAGDEWIARLPVDFAVIRERVGPPLEMPEELRRA